MERWNIEVFFKHIKTNLRIKSFVRTRKNTVKLKFGHLYCHHFSQCASTNGKEQMAPVQFDKCDEVTPIRKNCTVTIY